MTRKQKALDPAGPFTTGQLAKLLHVSPRTVAIWMESGLLKGYRLPKPVGAKGADRRFTRDAVMEFLSSHPDFPRPDIFVVDAGAV